MQPKRPLRQLTTELPNARTVSAQTLSQRRPPRTTKPKDLPWIVCFAVLVFGGFLFLFLLLFRGDHESTKGWSAATGALVALGVGSIIVFIFSILPCIFCYRDAQRKNIEPLLGLMMGLVFGWLGWIIMLFISPRSTVVHRQIIYRQVIVKEPRLSKPAGEYEAIPGLKPDSSGQSQ